MTMDLNKWPIRGPRSVMWLLLVAALEISSCASPYGVAVAGRSSTAIVDGLSLEYLCEGVGSPTVVIESGLGDPGVEGSWVQVAHTLRETTRVCRYNREGLGRSAAPRAARTSLENAIQLHALLQTLRVPPPYVLVGHSIGGFAVRLYADRYPDEVVGLVLVDSSHPDQWARWAAALPTDSAIARTLLRVPSPNATPERLDAAASLEQVRRLAPLADMPLTVISHGKNIWAEIPMMASSDAATIEATFQSLQRDLASLSSRSTRVAAPQAGHFIQADQPQIVIDAILRVVDSLRK